MGQIVKVPDVKPITIGAYSLTATGLEIKGRPSFKEHEGVGDFIQRTVKASGWWLADWLRYGESRADWAERLDQIVESRGISEKRAKNIRAIGSVDPSRRRDDVEFGLYDVIVGLSPDEQTHWLEQAAVNGWTRRELRLAVRSAKRRRIIEGQAVLEGVFRVIYADPPWTYGDRPPSGSGQADHYPGMTIEQLCKLPVAAHAYPNAVLFMWATAPLLLANPGPREVLEAWGFTYKTNQVWDKVLSAGGNYVAAKHEHLIIATRGSCTPDRPTPMFDSVIVERREQLIHSEKPKSFRQQIERMYDGPYLELFGRDKVDGWTVFGNDASLWHEEG